MFRFFPEKKKNTVIESETAFDAKGKIPKHVAIIMDGNGRWAENRRLPRAAGHKEGMNTVKKITVAASRMGIRVLTVYAFSTENWKRPTDEVNYLMKLPVDFFDTFVPELIKENVKVEVMGYIDFLPVHTQAAVRDAIAQTAGNTGMVLNFALNYGSRAEIVTATQNLVTDFRKNDLPVTSITEEIFADYLMTNKLKKEWQEPELLIRTSGEERISNFLLWQIAYSELYFTNVWWPDFDESALKEAVGSFQHRDRRFGGVKKNMKEKGKGEKRT